MEFLSVCAVLVAFASATTPRHNAKVFDSVLSKRQGPSSGPPSNLIVDLGYEQYQGVANASTGLNTWKGYVVIF